MPMLVAGLLLVWLSSILLRGFVRANPAALARSVRKGGGTLALLVAVFMIIRGEFNVAFGAAGLGLWLLGTQPQSMQGFFSAGRGSFGGAFRQRAAPRSRVRSQTLEMVLDQATGQIRGQVLAGPYAGRDLDGLSRVECADGFAWCARADPQGARLLEAYFDRRFPDWRQAADFWQDPGPHGSGGRARQTAGLSHEEAYEILGLAKGASREDVARAHRRLMKLYHPDHGGSTDMAARVNQAKDGPDALTSVNSLR